MDIDDIMNPRPAFTPAQRSAAILIVAAVAEAIRAAGEVPSGHIYALVCDKITASDFERILGILIRTELVSRDGQHLLRWIGPTLIAEPKGRAS